MTFQNAVERYFQEHGSEWRGAKTGWLFEYLMATHAYPALGKLAITEPTMGGALRVLTPIWQVKKCPRVD